MTDKKLKILLVDDMEIIIEIIKCYLNNFSSDLSFVTANNGRDACKLALHEQPDLIIMDWEMPKMTGLDALQVLKKNTKTSSIPVIILSGFSDKLSTQKVLDLGAVATLVKPISEDQLNAIVAEILSIEV